MKFGSCQYSANKYLNHIKYYKPINMKYLVDSLYQLDGPIPHLDLCCSFIVKTGRKVASK